MDQLRETPPRELRIGLGNDVHELVEGRPLVLGGVTIPHSHGLAGHSDADALLHAVCDAILGATGRGDIGTRFPNTDPRWKGADSKKLLASVWEDVSREGWGLVNLDTTVLAEAPKLSPHIPAMKRCIGEVLGVSPDRVGIKATTSEGLGFVGRKEGIMASAVVLLARGGA
jgi:2-C-methyl-D-erythritol 2,4-cyclodiphosphate synthase